MVQLGRYVVLDRIGSGGMGVVYSAFDPQLDRKIALKVLRAGRSTATDSRRARLLREAQALARLTHPNVVAIYDAGAFEHGAHEGADALDAQIFIAMEYVEGRTLTQWLTEPHSLVDVVETMIQAGRGLAAAHAAGLVHRDFKPDNVMVSADPQWGDPRGRVRVMDFGLARADHEADVQPITRTDPRASSSVERQLTTEGALVGTPAYMAPEQHLGLPTDARSDQFAFCVALWEAVFGRRPFTAASLPALAFAVTQGHRDPPAPSARVPRWLRRACERGLAPDPAHRFASMQELLDALQRGLRRRRARTAVLVGAASLAGVLGVWGWQLHDDVARARECTRAADAIAAVWPGEDDTARASMRASFVDALAERGGPTAEKVEPWLDRWTAAWTQARESTCRAHQVSGAWDDARRARADECLAERRSELAALVTGLVHADAELARRAVGAAAGLASAAPCGDAAVLARRPELPVDALASIGPVREALARATTLASAAKYDEALALAEQALADAESIGWPPLRALGELRVGVLLERKGDFDRSEAALRRAYVEAGRAGALETTADAALNLVFVVGTKSSRHREALAWAQAGEVAVAAA
jgi:hypothetical protein